MVVMGKDAKASACYDFSCEKKRKNKLMLTMKMIRYLPRNVFFNKKIKKKRKIRKCVEFDLELFLMKAFKAEYPPFNHPRISFQAMTQYDLKYQMSGHVRRA